MASQDKLWLDRCVEEAMPVPPFDRYIYVLPQHVVKKPLTEGELGYEGYIPETTTVKDRDENEIRAVNVVREYTDVPVPDLVHQGNGYVEPRHRTDPTDMSCSFTIWERIPGITVNEQPIWDKVTSRQREGLKLQVQGFIKQLAAKVPNPQTGSVRTLSDTGKIIHNQLPHQGPFESTRRFLEAYGGEQADVHPLLREINPNSVPVFSHLDWDLSNIILHPNMDSIAAVIDWERAAFFPEAGKSIHRMCHQWEDWEKLFDGLDFPEI